MEVKKQRNAMEFSMHVFRKKEKKVKHAHYPCSRSNLCEHNYLTMIKADVFFSSSVGLLCSVVREFPPNIRNNTTQQSKTQTCELNAEW